ncbi:MAG TPA: septum formation initiator family protein [Thermoanaerobaculia bacterium]|nr:septum formation initiator family protein [Thermoanaerobaculia bacterium]
MTEAAAASIRPRPLRSLVSAVVACLLLALAVAALKGWRDYQQTRAREERLKAEIAATETRIGALERKIERLQNDPATLDRVAREELGLVRPDEVVIVLPETPQRSPGR